jgi:hypothetical protein
MASAGDRVRGVSRKAVGLLILGVGLCLVLPAPFAANIKPLEQDRFAVSGMRAVDPLRAQPVHFLGTSLARIRFGAKHVYAGDSGENDAELTAHSSVRPGILGHTVSLVGMCGTRDSPCWHPPEQVVSHQFQGNPANLRVWRTPNGNLRFRVLPWSGPFGDPYGYELSMGWHWDMWLLLWLVAFAAIITGARTGLREARTRTRRASPALRM